MVLIATHILGEYWIPIESETCGKLEMPLPIYYLCHLSVAYLYRHLECDRRKLEQRSARQG